MLKSLSTQFAATLFFGPLGLAYSSVAAAVFLTLLLSVLYFTAIGILAIAIIWPISMVVGVVFVKIHNDGMRQSGSRLLLGPGEDGELISTIGSWGRGLAVLSLIAVAAILTLLYLPSSDIGRIVDAPASVSSPDSTPDVVNGVANSVANNVAKDSASEESGINSSEETDESFRVVTLDQRTVTPVVIGTSSASDSGNSLYVQAEVVNLREGPGTGFSILAQVERGDELTEIARNGQWVNVTAKNSGTTGWIFGRLVAQQ